MQEKKLEEKGNAYGNHHPIPRSGIPSERQ
jgi:hypothetical protein